MEEGPPDGETVNEPAQVGCLGGEEDEECNPQGLAVHAAAELVVVPPPACREGQQGEVLIDLVAEPEDQDLANRVRADQACDQLEAQQHWIHEGLRFRDGAGSVGPSR